MKKDAFLTHLSIEVQTLDFWLEQEWLVPARSGGDLAFSDTDIARARMIQDLKGGFRVNDEGIDIILHLLDQLHGFRQAFEGLQDDLRQKPR